MEGWGEVGGRVWGRGLGHHQKNGSPKKRNFFYGIRVLTWRVTPFNLVSVGLFEYSFIQHVLWCVIPN